MLELKELHHEGQGYDIVSDLIPTELLDKITNKLDSCYPVRASSHKKQYAEGEDIKKLHGIAVWWSQLTDDWEEIQQIHDLVFPTIKQQMPEAEFYASDIVTINGPSRWVSPHVDSPHRFETYNNLADMGYFDILGIQVIIPLETLDAKSGATGLLPNSHRKDWPIQDCYDGIFDDMFKEEAIQHELPKGSVLFYNTRLLHSTMPMRLPKKRSICLLNYLRGDIIDTITSVDNIWSSNGK